MVKDVFLNLKRLICTRENDGTGHSEPYIWPVMLRIDDNTLATPGLVAVHSPSLENARVVIMNGMRAGDMADIPASTGRLRARFEDGLNIRRLILAVALWEWDETPDDAVRAGFQAFSGELRAAIADNLLAFSEASEEEEQALIDTIKARVKNRVRSAIKDGLTAWEKARVFAGTLNLDDVIDSNFEHFKDFSDTGIIPISLAFMLGSSDEFKIEGELEIRSVPIELCQDQVNRVQAAQRKLDGLYNQIKALQAELQQAPSNKKPFLISEIRRIRAEEIQEAVATLDAAHRSLEICRNKKPPVAEPGDVGIGDSMTQVVEKQIQGFQTKTFSNEQGNIAITIASNGKSIFVAIPKEAIALRNQMGDEEYKCLKACKDIPDLEKRLNCISRCTVTKLYDVYTF